MSITLLQTVLVYNNYFIAVIYTVFISLWLLRVDEAFTDEIPLDSLFNHMHCFVNLHLIKLHSNRNCWIACRAHRFRTWGWLLQLRATHSLSLRSYIIVRRCWLAVVVALALNTNYWCETMCSNLPGDSADCNKQVIMWPLKIKDAKQISGLIYLASCIEQDTLSSSNTVRHLHGTMRWWRRRRRWWLWLWWLWWWCLCTKADPCIYAA